MTYLIYGFIFGLIVPYMARKFSKFMPATFSYALYRIVKLEKSVSWKKKKSSKKYMKLFKSLIYRSVFIGAVTGALSFYICYKLGSEHAVWYLSLIFLLVLMGEVDVRTMFLPDILTIPLMLIGLNYSIFVGDWVNVAEAILGSSFGYVMPIVASLLFIWRHKDAFGGGDVKLLSALGAWFGIEHLLHVILVSIVIFVLQAIFTKKKEGAYGPSIVLAAFFVIIHYIC